MFRFTIRELVLLTLVVAMGVAWWIDQSRYSHSWLKFRELTDEDQWAVEVFSRAAVAKPGDYELSVCRDTDKTIWVKHGSNIRYEFPELPVFP